MSANLTKDRAAVGGYQLRQATEFGLSQLYKDQRGRWQADALQPGDQCYFLQGHGGAMKATATRENYSPGALVTKGWLSYGSTDSHSQMLYCFDRQETEDLPGAKERRPEWVRRKTQAFLAETANVADRWMWIQTAYLQAAPVWRFPLRDTSAKVRSGEKFRWTRRTTKTG